MHLPYGFTSLPQATADDRNSLPARMGREATHFTLGLPPTCRCPFIVPSIPSRSGRQMAVLAHTNNLKTSAVEVRGKRAERRILEDCVTEPAVTLEEYLTDGDCARSLRNACVTLNPVAPTARQWSANGSHLTASWRSCPITQAAAQHLLQTTKFSLPLMKAELRPSCSWASPESTPTGPDDAARAARRTVNAGQHRVIFTQ